MLNFTGKKDVQILESDLTLDFVREEWTVEPPALSNELEILVLEGNQHSDSQPRDRIGCTITIYFIFIK